MYPLVNFTIKEILQQPRVWNETFDLLRRLRQELREWLDRIGFNKDAELVFTGAGSSEFCANVAATIYLKAGYSRARSIPTTDLLSTPEYCLGARKKLVVTFARSGDSPESEGAYKTVRKYCPGSSHLVITCNKEGALAKVASAPEDYVLALPPDTNDKSLAMTSSFTTMLIASILVKDLDRLDEASEEIAATCTLANCILGDQVRATIEKISVMSIINRAVFLGSGAMKGIAKECHLKLQELTDGGLMCAYDTFMGLRHGHKAIIHEDTLIVYLLSNNPRTREYEYDLISQIRVEHNPAAQILVSANVADIDGDFDLRVDGGGMSFGEDNEYVYAAFTLVGQLLGWHFSRSYGLEPDSPSVSGAISRVVSGVKIHKI